MILGASISKESRVSEQHSALCISTYLFSNIQLKIGYSQFSQAVCHCILLEFNKSWLIVQPIVTVVAVNYLFKKVLNVVFSR